MFVWDPIEDALHRYRDGLGQSIGLAIGDGRTAMKMPGMNRDVLSAGAVASDAPLLDLQAMILINGAAGTLAAEERTISGNNIACLPPSRSGGGCEALNLAHPLVAQDNWIAVGRFILALIQLDIRTAQCNVADADSGFALGRCRHTGLFGSQIFRGMNAEAAIVHASSLSILRK